MGIGNLKLGRMHRQTRVRFVYPTAMSTEEDLQPIPREEVEIAVASLKKGSLSKLIIYQQNLFKLAGRP